MKRDMNQNTMSGQKADIIIDKLAIGKINGMIYRDPMHECGGILLGNISQDVVTGKYTAHVCDLYEEERIGTSSTFEFTTDYLMNAVKYVKKNCPDMHIIGNIHSHAQYQAFWSGVDHEMMRQSRDNSVYMVVSPRYGTWEAIFKNIDFKFYECNMFVADAAVCEHMFAKCVTQNDEEYFVAGKKVKKSVFHTTRNYTETQKAEIDKRFLHSIQELAGKKVLIVGAGTIGNATGKSASGIIANGSTSERDLGAQRSAGGADRQAGDQGGHLIADRFGGRNDPTNLDAQAANVNQKDQANVERNVANLAANPNNTVSMNVSNFNSVGERPDATMINVGVQDNTTGAIDEQHISFQNASHEMQQSWNDTANQADQTVDSSQNAGMTDEQIDIANDLCGAEDDVDDRLGSGWEHTDFDTSFLDAGITESEAPASAEVSSGESEGASEGVGEDNSGEGGSGGEDDGLGE